MFYPTIIFDSNKGRYEKNVIEFSLYATSDWIKELDLKIVEVQMGACRHENLEFWTKYAHDIFDVALKYK